ncbi:MAG: 4'-phosphopantetheinyl transferase family protein [Acutalibacteraceae bacterium]
MTELYLLNTTKLLDKNKMNKYLDEISPKRREKALRLVKDSDKALSIGGALLMEHFLKGKEIMYSKSGKPYCYDIHFNISHSGNMCLFGLSKEPVGVDIEQIRPYNESLAKRCFTKYEISQIEECADLGDGFTMMWTLKESFIKCLGKGLSLPLREIEITANRYGISVVQDFVNDAFHFGHYHIDGYKISACSTDSDFACPEDVTDLILK